MSQNNFQNTQQINIQNKNLIPHPNHKKEKNKIKNTNNKKLKKVDNSEIIKNIFDSLINLSKNQKENNVDNNKVNNSIELKLSNAKIDMKNVIENINKLNNKMINTKKNIEKLEINKSINENEIINLVSNKETLEEMYNIEISFIKDGKIDNYTEIKISKEEIQKININKFITQIINLIKELNNNIEKETYLQNINISEAIIEIYNNYLNQLKKENEINEEEKFIQLFSIKISEIISDKLNKKYPLNTIKSLIHYLIKFNFIDEQIINCENYIKIEYALQKQEIEQEMIELTTALIFYEKQKHEILSLTSKLQDELKENNYIKSLINNQKHNSYLYESDNNDFYYPDNIPKEKEEINIKGKNNKNQIKNQIQINSINSEDDLEKKAKRNKIYENYLNNGNDLNKNKNKSIQINNKINYTNISEYNNKTNINYNYNFNTNFVDIKPIKRKKENNKKNILVLRSIFNSNRPQRKKYNSNSNLNEYNTNPLDKKNNKRIFKINQKEINKNKNIINNKRIINSLIIKKNLKQSAINKTITTKEVSSLSNNKKTNLNNNRILTYKKSFSRTNNNTSPQEKNKSNNTSMKNIRNRITNSNLILNINNNINFDSNISYKKYKNISNLLTDNIKDININLNNLYKLEGKNKINNKINNNNNKINSRIQSKTTKNSKEKNISNYKLNPFNQEKIENIESFCYFKFLRINANNTKKFNPLNVCSINPEHFDYYECYISLDFNSGSVKISPKISLDKIKYIPLNDKNISIMNSLNKSFYIQIKLNEINFIKLEKYAKDIIKVQNILSDYNKKENNNFNINKLLNKKEIKEIKLEQSEKIKAALCNFFPFSLNIKNKIRVDLVFINYEQFNIWLKNMNSIIHNNIKLSKI